MPKADKRTTVERRQVIKKIAMFFLYVTYEIVVDMVKETGISIKPLTCNTSLKLDNIKHDKDV